MDCQQARKASDELIESGRMLPDAPYLEAHLASCPECRDWYHQELKAVRALEVLETYPVPEDFTERVLGRLSGAQPEPEPSALPREPLLHRLQQAWGLLLDALNRPAYRRRLVPALVVAASLVLVLGLAVNLRGGEPSTTPGAAFGVPLWIAGGGAILVVALVLVVLIFQRRN